MAKTSFRNGIEDGKLQGVRYTSEFSSKSSKYKVKSLDENERLASNIENDRMVVHYWLALQILS